MQLRPISLEILHPRITQYGDDGGARRHLLGDSQRGYNVCSRGSARKQTFFAGETKRHGDGLIHALEMLHHPRTGALGEAVLLGDKVFDVVQTESGRLREVDEVRIAD